jgi:hypothetical protein
VAILKSYVRVSTGAKWRAPVDAPGQEPDTTDLDALPFDGMTNSHGDVVWRRCTEACEADDTAQPGHCRQDALNPNIGWGTCAPTACAKMPDCVEDVACNRNGLPVGCTDAPDGDKCKYKLPSGGLDPSKCGFRSGIIWGFDHFVAQPGINGVRESGGLRNSCRCCEGLHDWGRRDQGTVSQHFACRFPGQ